MAVRDLTEHDSEMRERLTWSDTKLLRSLLVFLETQTWMKRAHASSADSLVMDDEGDEDCSLAEVKEAVEYISSHFRLPLEVKGVSFVAVQDEVEEVVDYARTYLNLSQAGYRNVWYSLCTCPDSRKWPNVLILCELAYSLPFFNVRVEQIFSSKILKTSRRMNMQGDTLNDLLEINIEGPPLSSFCPDEAIELWWHDCTTSRHPNQQHRKDYRPRNPESSDCSGDTLDIEKGPQLELWDDWFDAEVEDTE